MVNAPKKPEDGDEPNDGKAEDQRERRAQWVVIIVEALRLAAEVFRWL
ncbi:hypothetical protein [Kitasatospora indigofera]